MPRNPAGDPEPDAKTTRRGAAAASSPGSADSSTSNGSGSGFVTDPGPAHDADAAPPPQEAPAADVLDGLAWDTDVVKGLLTAQGQALHTFAGRAESDWVYTRDELRAIAPPLTRILNRYDATRAAAATGDELALLLGLTGYVGRSIDERRKALRALHDDGADDLVDVPVYGPQDRPADFDDDDDELRDTPPIAGRQTR